MRGAHLLAVLPLTCLLPSGAFAQCTKPLAMVNEIQMESTNGGPSLIPVKVNGTNQKLTLATAGTTTQISADTAKALNLEIQRGDTTLYDDLGRPSRDQVTIADFSMGRLHGTNVKWPISPGHGGRGGGGRGDGDGGGSGGYDSGSSRGLFSLNYMRPYDVDADFGSDKLRFFSQDHCPGGVLYWKAPGAVGTAPITIDNGRVTVPVVLDGKPITAVIDTAAANSSVRATVAERVLGIELGGAKAPADRPSKDPFGGPTYSYSASAIAIGALTLNNVTIDVRADLGAGLGEGSNSARIRASGIETELAKPELVLGMDTLRQLHIYLAFGENKLYVTGTTNTLPAATAAAAAPAKTP